MKFLIIIMIFALGICSVIASPTGTNSTESGRAGKASSESSNPGV